MPFRAFIAVEIDNTPKLDAFSKAVKATGAPLKMVNLDNIHVTLKFLGDTDEGLVPEIRKIIESAVEGVEPFKVRLRGSGAFPNERRISVVWAGMEGAEALGGISEKLNAGLEPFGFEPERRKFSPHVTVSRVKGGRNKEELVRVIGEYREAEFGEQVVDKVILKKSVLTPQGPIYSDISVARLAV